VTALDYTNGSKVNKKALLSKGNCVMSRVIYPLLFHMELRNDPLEQIGASLLS